jgi:hypothetical protein
MSIHTKFIIIDEEQEIRKSMSISETDKLNCDEGLFVIICIDPTDENYLKQYYQGEWHIIRDSE